MTWRLRLGDHEIEVEIVARRPKLLVRVDGVQHQITEDRSVGNDLDLEIDGSRYQGWRCSDGDDVHVRIDGTTSRVRIEADTLQSGRATAQQEVRADMPGMVIALHCEPGQALHAGDKLLTMESMKLQVTLVASHAATVERIHVAPNAVFERRALLVSFAHAESNT